MAHRSSPCRLQSSSVGSYTATSSRPFSDRFFEELGARLAREEAAPAVASRTVRLGEAARVRLVLRALPFPPASRA